MQLITVILVQIKSDGDHLEGCSMFVPFIHQEVFILETPNLSRLKDFSRFNFVGM